MTKASEIQDELTEEEAAKRRDEALKRALNMPPKPHKSAEKREPEGPRPPVTTEKE